MDHASLLSVPWISALAAAGLSIVGLLSVCGLGTLSPTKDRIEACGFGLLIQGFCFGVLGLVGLPLIALTITLIAIGISRLPKFLRLSWDSAQSDSNFRPHQAWAKAAMILSGALIFSRFLFALYPQLQADPLTYHVTSAKIWALRDHLSYIEWLPWALQGGLFEYYFTMLATMCPEPVTLLLSCQASHVLFGSLITALVVFSLVRLVGLSKGTSYLVVLAAMLFPIDSLMMIRAKNDGVTLLFSLLAVRSFLQDRTRMGGLFAGASIATKWSALFFVIPTFAFVGFYPFKRRTLIATIRTAAELTAIAIAVALPIALRNWLWTENPMFPAMGHFFPSPQLTSLLLDEVAKFTHAGNWHEGLLQKSSWYLWSIPPVVLAIVAPFVRGNPHGKYLLTLAVSILIFFAVMTGTSAYPRFVLVDAVLFCLSAGFVWQYLEQKVSKFLPWLILAGILCNTGIDVPISNVVKRSWSFWTFNGTGMDYLSQESPLIRFQNQINNLQLSPKPIILGCYENESLFVDGGETIPVNHAGGSRVFNSENLQQLPKTLTTEGFTHLLVRKEPRKENACWGRFVRDPHFTDYFELISKSDLFALYRPIMSHG